MNEEYGKDSVEGFHLLDDDNTTTNNNNNSIRSANTNGRHSLNHHHDDEQQEENGVGHHEYYHPFSTSIISSSSSFQLLPTSLEEMINFRKFWDEFIWLVWDLALPQTLLQLGLMFSSAVTAMYVGRTMGSLYLDGFTLGNLTGNLFVTSLLQGLFSASDTLSPQAFGAGNPRELGLLAIRGTVASFLVIVPIIAILWTTLERIFLALHQDEEVAKLATRWFQVFCLGLPSYSISMMMWRFLAAQNLMHPQVVVGITANLLVLPICLVLCTEWLGFVGSAAANATFSTIHTIMLWSYLWYFQPHVQESWPGFCWREALQREKVAQYIKLGLGGMLTYTEWVYWEFLGLASPFPFALGIQSAQLISLWSLIIGTVVFALLSLLLYILGPFMVSLFTKESEVVEGCIYGIVMGISTGLGMQWTLGIACLIILFGMGLPTAYYFAIFRQGGLQQIWFWINPPYLLLSLVMLLFFLKTSWQTIANEIRARQECSDETIIGISSTSSSDGRIDNDSESRSGRARYGSTDSQESLAEPLVPLAPAGEEEQA